MPDINQYMPRSGRVIKEDGTVVNEANGNNADGSRNVSLSGSNVPDTSPVPQKIVKRKQTTMQTHNAVSVPANNTSMGTWIDTDGYTDIGLTLIQDATSISDVRIYWSNDNSTIQGAETVIASGNPTYANTRAGLTSTKARYAKIGITNGDATNPHTMSVWAYLKA
ncbi:hypothetical protein [Bacillus sp. 1NLA3E]|uniref:hypothetical protein n=1 Tax=Bacillus sp. 1NLA3E TaxID=666686 RepID=UPI000247E644|nr:hypothetical protein [Bacillus sp. 1NLA3E]AGK52041.1 hypothetical protein B1NLA3E_01285 [Bacillus sp. 1NLA3E]